MPVREFPTPFNETFSGTVAGGTLSVEFGPPTANTWRVQQISIDMASAPAGATCIIRYMGAFVTQAASARRATAGGDPPIFLHGGERMTVTWTGVTNGDKGNVLVTYIKGAYS